MLDKFSELSADPDILGGKPCIKGSRISVDIILEWVASGASLKEIVAAYPHLSESGVKQALEYAAQIVKNEIFVNVRKAS